MIKKLSIFLLCTSLLTACGQSEEVDQSVTPEASSSQSIPIQPLTVSGVTISGELNSAPIVEFEEIGLAVSELLIADQALGEGASVPAGARVLANYVGYGLITGNKFDSSWDRGQPIEFGLDQVIQGWTQGVPGMKIGGRRILVIPAELAYGQNPPPGSGIEPGEPLIFVIDLIDFI